MLVTPEELETQINLTKEHNISFIVFIALPECSHCEEYETIFKDVVSAPNMIGLSYAKIIAEQGSVIKRKYLKAEKGERIAAPATLFFQSGEMVRRHFGKMTTEQLQAFIKGEEVPKPKQKTVADLTLNELNEAIYKAKTQIAEFNKALALLEWEVSKR